jgi:prepilin-type N-terminal cleavage/methylation domain-containing protein
MSRKNGFTLIEIMVSLVVFAMVMTAMGSAFYKTYKDWQRQRDYNLVLENGRWAMEFMSNEIRQGHSLDFEDIGKPSLGTDELTAHSFLTFTIDPLSSSNKDRRIYYWPGNSTLGEEPYAFYRSNVKSTRHFDHSDVTSGRRELCRFVVNNTNIFSVSECGTGNCTVEMNLTLRPKPDQPESPGNRNYNFRTTVRARN